MRALTTSMLVLVACLALGVSTTMGMHHNHMKGGKGKDIMKTMMAGMMLYMKESKTCPNPVPFFSMIYGMICDTEGCADNGRICLNALMPMDDDMCQTILSCMPDPKEAMSMPKPDKSMFGECVMRSCMATKGLEYVEGDMKGNMLAILGVMVGMDNGLTQKAREDLITAVMTDDCVVPGKDMNMMEEMRFKSCLVKTCVRGMAAK